MSDRLRAVRWTRVALIAAIVVVSALILAQLFLPGIAADRIRDRLRDEAQVRRVEVRATPAITLLWKHADEVDIDVGELRTGKGGVAGLLDDARGVDRIDARVALLRAGGGVLRDVTLRKAGDRLVGSARATSAEIAGAARGGLRVAPVGVQDGTLVLRGGVSVLGQVVGATARLQADGGAIKIVPDVPLIGAFLELTVFSDARLSVDSVRARAEGDSYVLTAVGHLT